MAKNIVICSDGTGNTTIKGRGTNVFKLYEAIDINSYRHHSSLRPQIAFYDDGVGTENMRWLRLVTGATGLGLGRNIRRLYAELVRVYEQDDSVYLFGFSRGAFTVRMLARMIDTCGILKPIGRTQDLVTDTALKHAIKKIYWKFLNRDNPPFLNRRLARNDPATKQYSFHKPVNIKFIGVWDTVDAVGFPRVGDLINKWLLRFKALDCNVPYGVDQACHALAIDDERATFHPLLWDEAKLGPSQKIEQVWFAGAHSNVGGGYPRQGMSLVALDWMMSRAEECGLKFIKTQRILYQELQNVDDKLYDSRRGLQIFYTWKPRDIVKICSRYNTMPCIHISVVERLARRPEGYAPSNIPKSSQVVSTDQSQTIADECAQVITNGYEAQGYTEQSILEAAPLALRVGAGSYWLFMLAGFICMGTASVVGWHLFSNWLSKKAEFQQWWDNSIWLFLGGLLLLITSGFLAHYTDKHFEQRCADFWHRVQSALRQSLGL